MRRRWVLLSCALVAALALGAACGYLGGVRAAQEAVTASAPTVGPTADSMEAFRTERQQLRQMQLSQLNEIVYAENSSDEIVTRARARQMELMEWAEQEQTLEGVLSARGFEDVLATVHGDSVNVLVRTDALTREQTAVILELVMRETGVSGGNVKIIPVN